MPLEKGVMVSTIALVIPVYNDRESLRTLLRDIQLAKSSTQVLDELKVLVVDDGSVAEPTRIDDLSDLPFPIELITLKRNVGHQRAIAIGLCHVIETGGAELVAVMDGDGEDRPSDLVGLVEKLHITEADLVVAARRKRQEGLGFKIFYRIYKAVFQGLTGKVIQFGNFSVMRERVVTRIVHMDELWMHFPGTLIRSGYPPVSHLVDRGRRYAGASKMNLVSLITHGLRSVALFTEEVLTRFMLFCGGVSAVSGVLIFLALMLKVVGHATPGWLTTAVGILLVLLIQTATITLLSLLNAMNTRNGANPLPIDISKKLVSSVERAQS